MEALGINITSILIYSVLFGVVYVILNKFLTTPLVNMIDKRKADIKEVLRLKSKTKEQLDSVSQNSKEAMDKVKEESRSISKTAKQSSMAERKEILEQAKAEAEVIITKAKGKLAIDRKKMEVEFAKNLEVEAKKIAKELYQMDKVNIDKALIDNVISKL